MSEMESMFHYVNTSSGSYVLLRTFCDRYRSNVQNLLNSSKLKEKFLWVLDLGIVMVLPASTESMRYFLYWGQTFKILLYTFNICPYWSKIFLYTDNVKKWSDKCYPKHCGLLNSVQVLFAPNYMDITKLFWKIWSPDTCSYYQTTSMESKRTLQKSEIKLS